MLFCIIDGDEYDVKCNERKKKNQMEEDEEEEEE